MNNEKSIIELSWDELSLISGGDCAVTDNCGPGGNDGSDAEGLTNSAQGSYASTYDESGGP